MAIILDINKKSNNVNALITLRQADQGIQKEQFKILKDGMPYDLNGKIVKFEGTMPNGFFTIGHCTITNSKNGECEYTFTLKDTSVAGVYQQAYIRVYKGQDQIASQNIQVKVLRNSDLDPEQAKYYLKEYDKLLSDLKDYVDSGKSSWEDFVDQNREIIESVDPGGLLLSRIGIFNNFREWDYTVIEKMANEFTERGVNVKWFGAIGDGINDDTEAIQAASKNSTLTHIPRLSEYSINQTVSLSSSINSDFATLKAKTKGLEKIASYEDQDVVEISNLKFDLNEIARGGLHFKNCKKVIIKNCEFTGYSADYGYYKTDSCLLIQDCIDVTIDNCHFHDTGFKYGEELETLNRCITLQTSVNFYEEMDVSISGCKFNKANQGIITGSTKINLKISDCTFKETKDNSVYLIPVGYCQISNCYFDDRFDEAIVCMGNDILITNTIFKNAPNKSIAIAGDVETLAISNCTFDFNDVYTNNILSYRSTAYKISRLSFNSNILSLKIRENDTTDVFELGNIDLFSFCDNQIFVKEGGFAENKRLLSFRGGNIQSGIIKNNIFTGENIAEKAYFANGSGMSNIVFENNVNNCRIPMGVSSKFTELKSNINAIVGLDNRKIMTADSAPGTGSWKVGDIILTKNPSLSTPSRKHFGWVCVEEGSPGKWKIFGSWE